MASKQNDNKVATVVEVAQLAGVSTSTVSRVFDSKWAGRIKPETREMVLAAAKTLGYHGANALARGLSSRKSNIVALVIGRTTGYFYLEVIMKFVRELQATGRQVLIFEADPDKNMEDIVRQAHQYRVDAVVITAAATSSAVIDLFLETSIPVVAFNRYVQDSNISAVYCDGRLGAGQAADFLLANGHRTFGVISGDANLSKELQRVEGFAEVINSRGGRVLKIVEGDYGYESGYDSAKALFSDCRPEALFCTEDTIAMGAMDAARDLGISIPNEMSVMGFDNTSVGRFQAYALTTMAHPVPRMIEATIEIIEKMLARPGSQFERVFSMRTVVRDSVRLSYSQPSETSKVSSGKG